jgi:uncharacterized protein involved in exopolysaccharide biosynthesis
MQGDDDSDEENGAAVPPLVLLRSYLAYVRLALKRHTRLAVITPIVVFALGVVAVIVWPRTYSSLTVLSASDNRVLVGERSTEVFRNVDEIIRSRENVAALVKQIDLAKRWDQTQPIHSRVKSRLMALVRGEMSEAVKRDALVQMVQNSIAVTPPGWNQSRLTISVDWSDPQIAADLADAALQSFLRSRQVAEISSYTEFIAILEGHASQLREEITKMAGQEQGLREEKAARAQSAHAAQLERDAAALPTTPTRPTFSAPAPAPKPVEDLSELRAELETKQNELKGMEEARRRRLADAEAQLIELRTKFTAAHPMVAAAEATRATFERETPQAIALRSEVASLASTLKAKQGADDLAARGGPRLGAVPPSANMPGASSAEPLPAEIMRLMQEGNEELDPAVAAQFRGAVAKYASLRDTIGTSRVDLDTAQAAFKHRYQIVIPAEAPGKPAKPKVPLILLGALVAGIGIGLVLALLAELRRGRVVENWQVYRLGVPLLGEARWPPTAEH